MVIFTMARLRWSLTSLALLFFVQGIAIPQNFEVTRVADYGLEGRVGTATWTRFTPDRAVEATGRMDFDLHGRLLFEYEEGSDGHRSWTTYMYDETEYGTNYWTVSAREYQFEGESRESMDVSQVRWSASGKAMARRWSSGRGGIMYRTDTQYLRDRISHQITYETGSINRRELRSREIFFYDNDGNVSEVQKTVFRGDNEFNRVTEFFYLGGRLFRTVSAYSDGSGQETVRYYYDPESGEIESQTMEYDNASDRIYFSSDRIYVSIDSAYQTRFREGGYARVQFEHANVHVDLYHDDKAVYADFQRLDDNGLVHSTFSGEFQYPRTTYRTITSDKNETRTLDFDARTNNYTITELDTTSESERTERSREVYSRFGRPPSIRHIAIERVNDEAGGYTEVEADPTQAELSGTGREYEIRRFDGRGRIVYREQVQEPEFNTADTSYDFEQGVLESRAPTETIGVLEVPSRSQLPNTLIADDTEISQLVGFLLPPELFFRPSVGYHRERVLSWDGSTLRGSLSVDVDDRLRYIFPDHDTVLVFRMVNELETQIDVEINGRVEESNTVRFDDGYVWVTGDWADPPLLFARDTETGSPSILEEMTERLIRTYTYEKPDLHGNPTSVTTRELQLGPDPVDEHIVETTEWSYTYR